MKNEQPHPHACWHPTITSKTYYIQSFYTSALLKPANMHLNKKEHILMLPLYFSSF